MKFTFLIVLFLFTNLAMAEFLPSSFSANFTQEYISSLKGKVKKGNGSIEYKFPGNIRFETSNPTHVLYVTNGKKSWYYSFPFIEGEEGELTESNSSDGSGLFTKFFDSLKNGLKANSLYDVKQEGEAYTLIFTKKSSSEVGMKKAKLIFTSAKAEFSNLNSIEIEFLDGKKSTMKLSDLKLNPNFDGAKFNFVAPPKTKIVPQRK